MASRREAMRERMKERLNNSQKPTTAGTDASEAEEQRSSNGDDDVDDDHDDEYKEKQSIETLEKLQKDEEAAMMIANLKEQSERLVSALTNKRKKVKTEISKETDNRMDSEDASEMLRDAQERMGKKLKADATASAAEEEMGETMETQPTVPSLGTLDEDTFSPQATSRSTISKTTGMTPRKAGISTAIRAKLAEKIKAAKDKGKDEAYSETVRLHKLAGKRGESKSTRFDDTSLLPKGEEIDEEDEMEKSFRLKLSTINRAPQKDGETDMPTDEEVYDFFTRAWEQTDKKSANESEDADATEAGAKEDADTQEQTEEKKKTEKKVSEEEEPLIGPEDDFSWLPYVIGRTEHASSQQKLTAETEGLFVPSMFEAPIEQKIFTESSPRRLEDEGFYVGVRPYVPNRNLYRMENRLLREIREIQPKDEEVGDPSKENKSRSKKWFGEDGRLTTLPNPAKEISTRPPIVDETEPMLVTRYYDAELPLSMSSIVGGRFQLDIDVNTVMFDHHHLFSQEHVRTAQLTRLYEEYVLRMKKQSVEYLSGKLTALKSAQHHVQDNIRRIKTDSLKDVDTALAHQEQRLREYADEIRLTRKQRDFEMLCDRTLVKNIIRTWKDIKRLRQTHGCTNTTIKLVVKKEETNQAEDEKQWEEDVEEEMLEIQEEVEAENQRQLEIYRSQLNLWKAQKLAKKEARKRQKEREKRRRDDEEEPVESEEQVSKDEEIINEPNLEKPERPAENTVAEARQRIEAKYNDIRRKPGEPKLYLELNNCATVTDAQSCPREEQQRRNDVSRCKIFVKVLFNNKEVSKTVAKPIGQDFIVRFAQIFNIEIMHWPESITFEIYETSGLSSDLLSTVYAAIPDVNLTSANVQLIEHNFSSELKRSYSHEGVGSGVPMQSLDTNKSIVNLTTSGYISASVYWATDSEGVVLAPVTEMAVNPLFSAMKGADVISAIGLSGLADMSKLTKWVEDSHLDPNDPANADIMHLMRPINEGAESGALFQMPQHFRLEHVQEEFNFATDEDIENNRRFRLIRLREQEVPGFKNQRIPPLENDIPDELFAAYERKLKEEEKLRMAGDSDSHHLAVAKFMQKIREQIMLRFHIATHQKTFCDMVYEEAVPNIGIIVPNLLKLTKPRRPLKPPRKPRKTVTAQNLVAAEIRILVNIVRAVGVPVRAESGLKPPPSRNQLPSIQESSMNRAVRKTETQSLVRPFVELMFQGNVLATSVADGPNPSWNEELCIPFRPPQDDYSATNLQMVNDILYLNIFDEYIMDVNHDERDQSSMIHQRIERRWLGSIKVPFSTIYANGRIDGTFRVDKPPVLLGYTKESGINVVPPLADNACEATFGDSEHMYLTMFLTIEPQLVTPEPVIEKFESLESDDLIVASETWQIELEKKFPNRHYKATVINFEAKSVLIMRYIKPLNPPQELIIGEKTSLAVAKAVARYVSLIPSVSDSVIFPGLCDIWATSCQFLQMLQGDEEEHAVLLTNYFLFLGKTAWLVIGSAIPEGPTAYVLTREEDDFFLWNAGTGESFSCRDNYCPLLSVGCIVDADNIWGNIQPNDKPSQMSFNVSNTAHWKPLFHKGLPNPGIGSIQVDQLTYSAPNPTNVLKLQEKIEAELKKKMAEWRPRFITRWNRLCIQTFRRLLMQLEETQGKGLRNDHFSELDQVVGSYKLCGFPINLPYTEMKSITDSVYATGVYEYASSDVEFALAVHIQPYPNHVLSVWIYVASLVRIRT